MEYKIESYETKKGDGVALAQDKNGIWQLVQVKSGKYEPILGAVKYLTDKYVVINYGGEKVIDLETKKVVYEDRIIDSATKRIVSKSKISEIVNDIAITEEGRLIDLTTGEDITPEDHKWSYRIVGDLLVIDAGFPGNISGIFDTRTKKLTHAFNISSFEASQNNKYALIKKNPLLSTDDEVYKLYDIKKNGLIRKFRNGNISIKGSYIFTDYGIFDIKTFNKMPYFPKYSYGVYGDYVIETLPNGKRRIMDIRTGKPAVNKKFDENVKIFIKGDFAVVYNPNTILRKSLNTIYNLKSGESKKYGNKTPILLDAEYLVILDTWYHIAELIELHSQRTLLTIEDCEKVEKQGEFIVFFPYAAINQYVYNTLTKKSFEISYDQNYKKVGDNIYLVTISQCNIGFYASTILDNYATKTNNPTFGQIIDIGMLEKEDLYTSVMSIDDQKLYISENSKKVHDAKLQVLIATMTPLIDAAIRKTIARSREEAVQTLKSLALQLEKEEAEKAMKLYSDYSDSPSEALSNIYDEEILRRTKPE